jgi:DNA-binding protein YbaB
LDSAECYKEDNEILQTAVIDADNDEVVQVWEEEKPKTRGRFNHKLQPVAQVYLGTYLTMEW